MNPDKEIWEVLDQTLAVTVYPIPHYFVPRPHTDDLPHSG